MASLRKRGNKWQAQVRLAGAGPITRSFQFKKDAVQWATVQESKLRLGEYAPPDEKQINSTVAEMLTRCATEDVGRKRCADYERVMIGALLRTDLARVRLSLPRFQALRKVKQAKLWWRKSMVTEMPICSH